MHRERPASGTLRAMPGAAPTVLAVVHQDDAGPGLFAEVAAARGWSVVEWHASRAAEPPGDADAWDAVVVLGGAVNVKDTPEHAYLRLEEDLIRRWDAAGTPILGVCLGAQLVADALGGGVARSPRPEIGWFDVDLEPHAAGDPILGGLPPRFVAYQWHSYAFGLPDGAELLASSEACPQAFRRGRSWGVQFHPEVTEAVLEDWFQDGLADPDAVGFDIDQARAEMHVQLPAWMGLGRQMFDGFLAAAASARASAGATG